MREYLLSESEDEIVFRRGTVICVKHSSMFEPSLSVIQNRDGRNLYFRMPEGFIRNNVLKGDNIVCQILQNDCEYVVSGIVADININYPRLIEFSVDKVAKFKNNRVAKRYFVNFPANIILPKGESNIYAIIKNVSTSGIAAVFKEHVNTEILVNVKVSVSIGRNEFLDFKAKVIRAIPKSNFNEYGLEIVEIDDSNGDILDKLIFKLQEDESRFISEYLK